MSFDSFVFEKLRISRLLWDYARYDETFALMRNSLFFEKCDLPLLHISLSLSRILNITKRYGANIDARVA